MSAPIGAGPTVAYLKEESDLARAEAKLAKRKFLALQFEYQGLHNLWLAAQHRADLAFNAYIKASYRERGLL